MFADWSNFKTFITRMYEDIDEIRTAERRIDDLKQLEPAVEYVAKFQQYANRTQWNEDACKALYWKGLKDRVKDALIQRDRSQIYETMITRSIEINNDQYEKDFEKKGKGSYSQTFGKSKKFNRQQIFYSKKMKFDATQKSKKYRKLKRDKSKITCYGCENKDHYKNECKKQINGTRIGKPKQLNVIGKGSTVCKHCKRARTHRSKCVAERPDYLNKMKTLTFTKKQSILGTNEHEAMH